MGRFISPFSDWSFKYIFGQEKHKDVLIEFLNDLLEGEHVIKDVVFKDKEQLSSTKDMRTSIYDIFCVTDTGKNIIVEMQNRHQEHFVKRSIYYTAKAIERQAEPGLGWDFDFAPVYTVCFMNFNVDENISKKFRTDIVLADKETGRVFSDSLCLIYLMLPFFKKKEEECKTKLDCWIYSLKHMDSLDTMPFEKEFPIFKELADIAEVCSLSKNERDKYDESMKVIWDIYACEKASIKKGLRQGIDQNKRETALLMLQHGEPLEKIMLYSGLSKEQIESIS